MNFVEQITSKAKYLSFFRTKRGDFIRKPSITLFIQKVELSKSCQVITLHSQIKASLALKSLFFKVVLFR